jgi:hypothetical protein
MKLRLKDYQKVDGAARERSMRDLIMAALLGCGVDELEERLSQDDPGRTQINLVWAALGPANREKLVDYARLLVMDERAAREDEDEEDDTGE